MSADPSARWVRTPPPHVVVSVRTAPVPDVVPAGLGLGIVPVTDESGGLLDWALSADVVDPASPTTMPGLLARYRQWRSEWETRHVLGPPDVVVALRRIARSVSHDDPSDHDVALMDLLDALCDASPTARRLPDKWSDALASLGDVRTAIEVTGGRALAVVAPGPDRASRRLWAWPVPEEDEVLISGSSEVGIVLHSRHGIVLDVTDPATGAVDRHPMLSVELMSEPVCVTRPDGVVVELAPAAARPLAWMAPGVTRWWVEPLALDEVWRPVFDLVTSVADLDRGEGLDVTVSLADRVPLV